MLGKKGDNGYGTNEQGTAGKGVTGGRRKTAGI